MKPLALQWYFMLRKISIFELDFFWFQSNVDTNLQVFFQNLGEVVLEFGSSEVGQDLLPVWNLVEASKVWLNTNETKYEEKIKRGTSLELTTHMKVLETSYLQLSSKNLESGRFSNTVGSDETQHLSGSGHGESVKLERVWTITMSGILFKDDFFKYSSTLEKKNTK